MPYMLTTVPTPPACAHTPDRPCNVHHMRRGMEGIDGDSVGVAAMLYACGSSWLAVFRERVLERVYGRQTFSMLCFDPSPLLLLRLHLHVSCLYIAAAAQPCHSPQGYTTTYIHTYIPPPNPNPPSSNCTQAPRASSDPVLVVRW